MPRSKTPRKRYRPKVRQQLSGAGVLDDFIFRVESWGSTEWQVAALMHLVRPFDLLLRGDAQEINWSQAKVGLIEGYATASQFEECSRIRREIKAANKLMNAAFTYYGQKGEILTANVEAARDVCEVIVDMWRQMLPGEVTQGCRSLHDEQVMTWFESEMER